MDDTIKSKVTDFFAAYPLKHFTKGQILVQANENPEGIFYIIDGQVRQYDISNQGNEIVVNVFQAPAFFPMSWAITGTPNRYFFEAATNLNVHIAPALDAVNFLKQNPDVAFNLLARLYSGVEGLQRRMSHLMGGTARSRVIFELITECKRFGSKQSAESYTLELHEDELARRAGLTRETVNRELVSLKKRGLLQVERNQLVITNLTSLEAELGETL